MQGASHRPRTAEGVVSRREFSAKVKVASFERAAGQCELCTARLYPGKFAYDHRIPDGSGGEPTLENCQVVCAACHGAKTKHDVTKIAKGKRVRRRHIGIRKQATIRGWRRFDGSVVFADER